jgi:hypothetical protein
MSLCSAWRPTTAEIMSNTTINRDSCSQQCLGRTSALLWKLRCEYWLIRSTSCKIALICVSCSGSASDQRLERIFEPLLRIYHRYGCWLSIGTRRYVRNGLSDQRRRRYRRGVDHRCFSASRTGHEKRAEREKKPYDPRLRRHLCQRAIL